MKLVIKFHPPPAFDPSHPFFLKTSQTPSSEKIKKNEAKSQIPLFQGEVPTMSLKRHERDYTDSQ